MEGRDNLDPASGPPTLLGVSRGQDSKLGKTSQLIVLACAPKSQQDFPSFSYADQLENKQERRNRTVQSCTGGSWLVRRGRTEMANAEPRDGSSGPGSQNADGERLNVTGESRSLSPVCHSDSQADVLVPLHTVSFRVVRARREETMPGMLVSSIRNLYPKV